MPLLDRLLGRDTDEDERVGPPADLELDTLFDVLKNRRRRAVIRALVDDFDGSASVRDLSKHLALAENPSETPGTVTSQQRKRAYVSIYQTHLPKMDSVGVLKYDSSNRDVPEVRATEQTRAVYRVLETVEAELGGDA